jgi:hypothetical protein
MRQSVTCYSGDQYAQRPVAFDWLGNRYQVDQVLARWREQDGTRFRVRTTEGQVFDLFIASSLMSGGGTAGGRK